MPTRSPQELFLLLLSHVRQSTERTAKVFEEIIEAAENPNVKEALEARVFVADKIVSQLDECFELLDESPVKIDGRMQDIFVEHFREELAEIQNPVARHIFILARAATLAHLRIAELEILTAAADLTGHFGVGVLLETCLADQRALVERTRRLVQSLVEEKIAEKLAA